MFVYDYAVHRSNDVHVEYTRWRIKEKRVSNLIIIPTQAVQFAEESKVVWFNVEMSRFGGQ